MERPDFGSAVPILRVSRLEASVDYYVQVLGFKLDWQGPGIFASVSRGECTLFLVQGDQGHPGGWVWIGVPDAEAVWKEFQLAGARLRHPPANYSWALEMQVEDLDGNVLRMGSDPIQGAPYGEWLDMHGRRWQRTSGGGWSPV